MLALIAIEVRTAVMVIGYIGTDQYLFAVCFFVVLVMSVSCMSLLMLVYYYEPGWLLYILNSIST